MPGQDRRDLDGHAPSEPAQENGRDGSGAEIARGLNPQPVLLLADSQCLFGDDARRWLRPPQRLFGGRAVYLGASNGDDPAAFSIFEEAMAAAGYGERAAIRSPESDPAPLEGADLVLLAGGDPLLGWRAFEAGGLIEPLRGCWRQGALLVGVSAGAVHLGLGFRTAAGQVAPMFGFAPYWVGAHEEAMSWAETITTVKDDRRDRPALAIPFGAAARVASDGGFESLRNEVAEVRWCSDEPSFRWKRPVKAQ